MATPLRKDRREIEEDLETNEPTPGSHPVPPPDPAAVSANSHAAVRNTSNVTDAAETRAVQDGRIEQRIEDGEDLVKSKYRLDSRPQDSREHNPRLNPASEEATILPSGELENLRGRWKEIQTAFVDEPRRAVEQADGLVASATERLAEVFSEERSRLEQQWDRGDNASTEDLRLALQRYRAFFNKLLSV